MLTIPPLSLGELGDAFFIGYEYTASQFNGEYPGSTGRQARMNVEDTWAGSSSLPFNFANLGDNGEAVTSTIFPWALVNHPSFTLEEGLLLRAGMMVPGDEDGNFIPDACDIPCIGNLNGDDLVNSEDLGLLLAAWATECPKGCPEDINEDGLVDSADLGLVLGYWGPCPYGDTP